jgi:Ger(x)C family germination protein
MKRYSVMGIIILSIIMYVILNSGKSMLPIEKIDIPSGTSIDITKKNTDVEYLVSTSVYTFNKKNEIASIILKGTGSTFPETRSTRQTLSSRRFMVGMQKVFIFSDNASNLGFNPVIDIMFTNQDINDMGWAVICKGKALDMLQFKVSDFSSSSDYINGMVDSAREQNFMSQNYKLLDMYVRVNSEGRNLVLPYLEIVKNNITMTGMAVFQKDKMVLNVPMEEAKYMNFIRENKVKGILTVQKGPELWASTFGEVKRKVNCEKINGNYKFNIDLNFQGKVVNNTLYKDLLENEKTLEKYTTELEAETQKRCNEFIYKMQNEYKTDCLELGRDAAATFGRNKEIDWDDIVCNSKIIVNVKVKIDNLGRGGFLF